MEIINIKEAFGQQQPSDRSTVSIIIDNDINPDQRFTIAVVRLDKDGKSFALIAHGSTASAALAELNKITLLMINEIKCGVKLVMETLALSE